VKAAMGVDDIKFDEVWEQRYANPDYRNHYPWSSVVTFVFRNRPKNLKPSEVSILEVGCGNGSNLWFAAREGFRTAGVDGSKTAIDYARDWFRREDLDGDFHVGNFASLPFPDRSFDLVIDRAALSFANDPTVAAAVGEIRRVLRSGGRFMFTPYSDRCSSFDGLQDADGCYRDVKSGSINPGAQVRFYSLNDVRRTLQSGWTIRSLDHVEQGDYLNAERVVHAEWLVVAEKN
jgi:ubiquinone/menaquinone biosynthesis C-methylase UbiE